MNTKHSARGSLQRYILIFVAILLAIFLLAILLISYVSHVVSEQVQHNKSVVVENLGKELGLEITIQEVKGGWLGNGVGALFNDVVVKASEGSEAIATIRSIKITPDYKTLLWDRKWQSDKMVLTGLKTSILWDTKKNISIAGLKSKGLMPLITFSSIKLVDAEIDWQGPTLKAKQQLNAQLKWRGPEKGYVLKGHQLLQIREGKTIPAISFHANIAPTLESAKLEVNGYDFAAEGQLQLEKEDWIFEGAIDLYSMEIEDLQKYYLAEATDLKLLQWFKKAFISGEIGGKINIAGPLQALKLQGKIDYDNVDFQYASKWPLIEESKGFVEIHSDHVNIGLQEGAILGVAIETANATVGPFGEKPVIKVEGTVNGRLENGLAFLNQSPLNKSVAESLQPLNPRGPMELDIKLQIPLEKEKPAVVQGIIKTEDAEISLAELGSDITAVVGEFYFTEKSLKASKVTADWLEHPLQISIETESTNAQNLMHMNATGLFTTEFLKNQFRDVPQSVFNKIKGESLWTMTYTAPLNNASKKAGTFWTLSSDLKGTAILLPEPIGKEAAKSQNVTVGFNAVTDTENRVELSLEHILNAKLVLDKVGEETQIKRGQLVFGEKSADWINKDAIVIAGVLSEFNATWMDFLDESAESKTYPPIEINLVVNDLEVYGIQFQNTRVMSELSRSTSEWAVSGPNIKGKITLPITKDKPMIIDLDYLKLTSSHTKAANEANFSKTLDRSPIWFRCRELEFEKTRLGDAVLKLEPKPYGYAIPEMSLSTHTSKLTGQGEWHLGKDSSNTKLAGRVSSRAMGELFLHWGFPTTIREADGVIQYNLNWPNTPFQFHLVEVQGTAELRLNSGRILGVNPGLGRVLGLLNLKDIPKRLQLDFGDVFKKGFAFNKMRGKFEFRKGTVYTPQVLIDGSSAKVEVFGTVVLQDKSLDLDVTIVPQSGVGLAAALPLMVVNPLAAAGVAVLDQVTGASGKMAQQRFKVTGTWDFPSIKNVNESRRR